MEDGSIRFSPWLHYICIILIAFCWLRTLCQRHCGVELEATLFSWLHMYYAYLASCFCQIWALCVSWITYSHEWRGNLSITVLSGRGFKSHSGQKPIATSNKPSVVNITCWIIHVGSFWRDFLKKISIKINVATDEGNDQNEIGHWANNEMD